MDIESILNGSEPVESPVVAEEPVDTPEAAPLEETQPPRDEHGRFAPKGEQTPAEPEAAPPAAETPSLVPQHALHEERRKRQELEAKLDALLKGGTPQAQPQVQQHPQPQSQDEDIPVIFDDAYAQSIFDAAVAHVRQEMQPRLQQVSGQTAIEMQRMLFQQTKPDFAEVEQSFWQLCEQNPALRLEVQRQQNPVAWAYDYATKAREIAKIGSLDIEAIKAAAVQDYLSKQPAPQSPQPAPLIPTSLADTQSARTASVAQAPPSLNQILGRT